MKTTIATITIIISLFGTRLMAADDAQPKTISIEQRLQQVNIDIALKQYERVRMEMFEIKLQLDIIDNRNTDSESKAFTKKDLEKMHFEREALVNKLSALDHRFQILCKELSALSERAKQPVAAANSK